MGLFQRFTNFFPLVVEDLQAFTKAVDPEAGLVRVYPYRTVRNAAVIGSMWTGEVVSYGAEALSRAPSGRRVVFDVAFFTTREALAMTPGAEDPGKNYVRWHQAVSALRDELYALGFPTSVQYPGDK